MKISVNGQSRDVEATPDTPLLWALRDHLHLTGTKFGCGIAQCGACTVHLDGVAVRSCVTPLASVGSKKVTTIEGLSKDGTHPLQKSWVKLDVPQCGYCQSGMIMSAASLLKKKPKPTDADIDAQMGTQICRCGTYNRIRAAIHDAAGTPDPTSRFAEISGALMCEEACGHVHEAALSLEQGSSA